MVQQIKVFQQLSILLCRTYHALFREIPSEMLPLHAMKE